MKSYTFRVVIDTVKDSFRDIEISADDTFETLHNEIIKAYDFKGDQMTSFYMSDDDWEKGEEIALMDMGFGRSMSETKLNELIKTKSQKILYVYDFLKMWIFYVELVEINAKPSTTELPVMLIKIGASPDENDKEIPNLLEGMTDSKKSGRKKDDFDDEYESYADDFDEDFDDDDYDDYDDEFGNFDNIDDYDM